jgi:hypothetical protein
MGTNNKQRRQAKAKKRAEDARRRAARASSGWGGDDDQRQEDPRRRIREALWSVCGLRTLSDASSAMNALETSDWDDVAAEAEQLLEMLVGQLWSRGWQPAELARHARRSEPRVGRIVASAIAADHRRRDRRTMHASWVAQADEIAGGSAEPGWLTALSVGEGWRGTMPVLLVIQAGRLLAHAGSLPTILPPPGSDPDSYDVVASGSAPTDDPVLAKVRAILSQAESTTFEAEAETFMAKAQELIARHAIDTALLWSRSARTTKPVTIRIPIDDPYADQKSMLLHVVADSSQCRAVIHGDLGLMSLVGFPSDVAACEMLYTSLLVQAQTAMQAEAATAPPGARVRGRSFRSSFLQAYASRIGKRLQEINVAVTNDVETERAALSAAEPSLLPVLVERKEAVDAEVDDLFGELTKTPFKRTYDALGWARGDAAGERAELSPAVVGAQRPAQRRELAG